MSKGVKILLLVVGLMFALSVVAICIWSFRNQPQEVSTSEFINLIESGQLTKIRIDGDRIVGERKDGSGGVVTTSSKTMPLVIAAIEGQDQTVDYDEEVSDNKGQWLSSLINILFLGMLVFIGFTIIRGFRAKAQDGGGGGGGFFGAGNMTQDKAIRLDGQSKKTFADVGGIDEVLEEVKEIVDFLRNPERFRRRGARMPKGCLLVGQPGVGKTLIGQAVAGEAGVPFFSVSGSEFDEMFVGVGSARVRSLKKKLRENAPCVCFIDELESLGRKRGVTYSGGQEEKQNTLNQFLQLMDGMDSDSGIVFMAASNQPDVLDPAITRAGRFDRHIHVPPPDVRGREIILGIHIRNNGVPLAEDLDLAEVARITYGMTGADLENLVNEAALEATRQNLETINFACFSEAADKVQLGLARKSLIITPAEKSIICVHESGHVLASYTNPAHDLPQKVTCIPRGPGLGVTHFAPDSDRHLLNREQLLAKIESYLGGRVAEEVIIGQITTGASNDLEMVRAYAVAMVTKYAMTGLGQMSFGKHIGGYLGQDGVERDYSEETAKLIDEQVRKLVADCYLRVRDLIEAQREKLLLVAKTLYEQETLTRQDLEQLLGERPLAPTPFLLKS